MDSIVISLLGFFKITQENKKKHLLVVVHNFRELATKCKQLLTIKFDSQIIHGSTAGGVTVLYVAYVSMFHASHATDAQLEFTISLLPLMPTDWAHNLSKGRSKALVFALIKLLFIVCDKGYLVNTAELL